MPSYAVTRIGQLARLAVLCALVCLFAVAAPQRAGAAGPTALVINGTQVPNTASAWPYMVALVDNTDFQFCGGTLIAPLWVATAAHCQQVAAIIIGRKKLSSADGERIAVDEQLMNPAYNSVTHENDIQLLRLDHAPSNPQPLALASAAEDPAVGSSVSVAGWGVTEFSGGATVDDLREAQVEVDSNAGCDATYGAGTIFASMLCASHFDVAGDRDTCQGDSGGPLVTQAAGGARLAGITSFGNGCASYPFPGVYTRVSSFRDWVLSAIGKHLTADSEALDFGNRVIGSPTVSKTVTLKSTGSQAVSVLSASISGSSQMTITNNQCATAGAMPTGGSCQISVRYAPTMQGLALAKLNISTDSPFLPNSSLDISGVGVIGARSTPTLAPELKLAQSGRASSLKGGKLKVSVKAYFMIPAAINATQACSNNVSLTATIPGVRKSVKTARPFAWAAARCVATVTMRMPKKARHKKVAFKLRFAGNSALAAAEQTFKLRIK